MPGNRLNSISGNPQGDGGDAGHAIVDGILEDCIDATPSVIQEPGAIAVFDELGEQLQVTAEAEDPGSG
jgi:hypothetical protein